MNVQGLRISGNYLKKMVSMLPKLISFIILPYSNSNQRLEFYISIKNIGEKLVPMRTHKLTLHARFSLGNL